VAIADTGTSLLGAPRAVTQRMHWLLARKAAGCGCGCGDEKRTKSEILSEAMKVSES